MLFPHSDSPSFMLKQTLLFLENKLYNSALLLNMRYNTKQSCFMSYYFIYYLLFFCWGSAMCFVIPIITVMK